MDGDRDTDAATRSLPAGVPPRWADLTILGVLIAIFFLLYLQTPVNPTDEAWMLWVADRVAHGDRLYRDVYFVSTPLPAWIAGAAAAIAGTQIVALRALVALAFALEVVLADSIARTVGCSRRGRLVLALGLLTMSSPLVAFVSLYGILATLFALGALRATLAARPRPVHPAPGGAERESPDPHGGTRRSRTGWGGWSPVHLALAGVGAGLSIGAKPNVGLLVLAALMLGVAATTRPTVAMRAVLTLGTAAVGTTALLLAPLALGGSWSAFVDQVLGGKTDYLGVGVSYPDALRRLARTTFSSHPGIDLRDRWRLVIALLPLWVVLAVGWSWWRMSGPARRRSALPLAVAGAALVSVVPRLSLNHFAAMAPLALVSTVAVASGAPRLRPRWAGAARRASWLGVAASCAVTLIVAGHAAAGPARPVAHPSLPHFSGSPVLETVARRVQRTGRTLQRLTGGEVFMVRQDAGFWYLVAELRNPLPFDYPEVSDFGGGGEAGVIRRLREGQAEWVCLQPPGPHRSLPDHLQPRHLEGWVRQSFIPVEELPGCDLYRSPGPSRNHEGRTTKRDDAKG